MAEPRFYTAEAYWWEVWDRQNKSKAAVVRAGVLYPADDFPTEKSAQKHADRLNRMVEKAAAKGATQEVQDAYWQVLD